MSDQPNVGSLAHLIRTMLDRGYEDAAQDTLSAIAANSQSGVIRTRLAQVQAEAARLAEEGAKFTSDNPVLRALLADFDPIMDENIRHIDAATERLQQSGINAAGRITPRLALGGEDMFSAGWNVPDPEAVSAAVNYASSPAWINELEKYADKIPDTVRNAIVRGIVEGRGPLRIAREVTHLVEDLPRSQANNLMRTLQLSSYRQATAIHQIENERIIDHLVRIAALDRRTCMTCVTLHGTRLEIGEVVSDHHSGRCTTMTVLKNRRSSIELGEDWFARQDVSVQREMMGNTGYDLWRQGRFQLQDYVQPYQDDVFGNMVRQASLREILASK